MNALRTFTFNDIPKEKFLSALYGTIVFAGAVFIMKRIFGRKKINKKYYDKNKKKVCRRSKIFFNDLTKKIEFKPTMIQIKEEENLIKTDKYFKMKEYVKKVADSYEKSKILANNIEHKKDNEEKSQSKTNSQDESTNKKDQIFYFLLNNVSHMITHANCNR